MGNSLVDDEIDAHAGAIPDIDEPVLHDRIGQSLNDVVTPVRLTDRYFEGDVVLGQGGGDLNEGRKTKQAIGDALGGEEKAMDLGILDRKSTRLNCSH